MLDVRLVGVPAGVKHDFLSSLPSAVIALIFLAKRIQPFLSLVDPDVEFSVLRPFFMANGKTKITTT